jgi:biopolymer transport protein ExbB/TolQ
VQPPAKLYRVLKIVEGVGPGFGFLGTCLSLMATMHHMDPGLSQADMLKALLENASSAFGSTVYGISLAISSYIALELFQNFLIIPKPKEVRTKIESRPTPETVALNMKEV